MLFGDGYRPNVCIVLCNERSEIILCKRIYSAGWQFPQGGLNTGETPDEAMYRELYEEVGLLPHQVTELGRSQKWLHYNIPAKWLRPSSRGHLLGQKQIWFLLQLTDPSASLCFTTSESPEFCEWRWGQYWDAVNEVVEFKRSIYIRALKELAAFLPQPVPLWEDSEQSKVSALHCPSRHIVKKVIYPVSEPHHQDLCHTYSRAAHAQHHSALPSKAPEIKNTDTHTKTY